MPDARQTPMPHTLTLPPLPLPRRKQQTTHRTTPDQARLSHSKKTMTSQEELKKQTGYKAIDDYVTSGMKVGLGTGSTAYYAVERLGQKLKSGELRDIVAVPTSIRTKEQAESLGIPLVTLNEHSKLDVAIDGADNVDPEFNLVKGGGGALLREKMVELAADKFIVIGKIGIVVSFCKYHGIQISH